MSAIMETLAVLEHHPARHRNPAVQAVRAQSHAPAIVRNRPVEQWSSSLDPQDLQCLLALLEGHVLPQLIASYAPAVAAPVVRIVQPAS